MQSTISMAVSGILAAVFLGTARADRPAAFPPPDFAAVVREHREFYLRSKSPEQAARMPAMVWHLGAPMSVGDDFTSDYGDTHALGQRRDAARLRAVADRAAAAAPKAQALRDGARAAARAAAECAQRARGGTLDADGLGPPPDPDSEPGRLWRAAATALGAVPADRPRAAAALERLGALFERMADLDRWTELNLRWLVVSEEWSRMEGIAPRTLCYSIQARGCELASIQSRIEDLLWETEGERALREWELARAATASPAGAVPPNLAEALGRLRGTLAELRPREVALDRELCALAHARKIDDVQRRRRAEYLPLAVSLEFLAREAALLDRLAGDAGTLRWADAAPALRLSPTARAALAAVERALDSPAVDRLAPVLEQLLQREYGASLADLCLYQAAVMGTTKPLAQRLSRWTETERRPTAEGLWEMLHPLHGSVLASLRPDNAYDPRLLEWAQTCTAPAVLDRFVQARDRVNAFYRQHGYNQDQPVSSLRDALDSGLVDCLSATHMHGAVAAAAGITGIVPVRLWRDTTGHSFVALRVGGELWFLDPLDRKPPTKTAPLGPNARTVETYAMSFGSYVADEVRIVGGGRLLRLEIPYRTADR